MTPLTKHQKQDAIKAIAAELASQNAGASVQATLAGAKAILNHGNPLRSMATALIAWAYVMRTAYKQPDLAYLASELAKAIAEKVLEKPE